MRSRTFCTAQLLPPTVAVIEVRRSVATERTGERVKRGSAKRRISAASSSVRNSWISRTRGEASTCCTLTVCSVCGGSVMCRVRPTRGVWLATLTGQMT
eukprot:scaffold17683_cov69-Phaeocystis_antarctica.AAC.4